MNPTAFRHVRDFHTRLAGDETITGLRMAIATVAPVAWGIQSGKAEAAQWVALAAQAVCWAGLKGAVRQRVALLATASVFAIGSAGLGLLVARSLPWSVVAMAAVAYLAALVKGLGERGSSLAVSSFVLFVLTADGRLITAPPKEILGYVALGAVLSLATGLLFTLVLREGTPFRRSVASVWLAVEELLTVASRGWINRKERAGLRKTYTSERALRSAIDASLLLHPSTRAPGTAKYFAMARRAAALCGTAIASASDLLQALARSALSESGRRSLETVLKDAGTAIRLARRATLSRNSTDDLAALTAAKTLAASAAVVDASGQSLRQTGRLFSHAAMLLQKSIEALQEADGEHDLRLYRSPAALRAWLILLPTHWAPNAWDLLRANRNAVRYALRTAIAAAAMMALIKATGWPRSYWALITLLAVAQPYFGATLQKGAERLAGTVAGGLIGGLLLFAPPSLLLRELALTICAFGAVRYIRTKYAVGVAFLTVSLVIVLSLGQMADVETLLLRTLFTAGGASVAILAGFVLLPTWDVGGLPGTIAAAISASMRYYNTVFRAGGEENWTAAKRAAEKAVGAAFESFERFLTEPLSERRGYSRWYSLLTALVQINHSVSAAALTTGEESFAVGLDTEALRSLEESTELAGAISALLHQLGFAAKPEAECPPLVNWSRAAQAFCVSGGLPELTVRLRTLHRGLLEWAMSEQHTYSAA